MNDQDLYTALHRDADLVGEPSADLLDRLARRRQIRTRRRAGVLGAIAAVVVIAAGIPVGASVLARSEGGPADQPAAPTPSITAEVEPPVVPSPEVVPPPAPQVVVDPEPPVLVDVPELEVTPPPTPEPVCDWTAIDAALPPDSATARYSLYLGDGELCVVPWAAAGYSRVSIHDGEEWPDGEAGLFRHVDGVWTQLDRYERCGDADIPPAIWERACNVD